MCLVKSAATTGRQQQGCDSCRPSASLLVSACSPNTTTKMLHTASFGCYVNHDPLHVFTALTAIIISNEDAD